jgi:hypothetical protein
MPEQIYKLSPHRDLQCYFYMPSAIAAMSGASESGFTLSGKWRQQFDWAVVEWNRDNTFEHPVLRYLPDGDLSGLKLTYTEQRFGCLPIESNLVPVVDWNNLRIWATPPGGTEQLYHVPITTNKKTQTQNYILATPITGTYTPASATMTLVASPGIRNRVGVAMPGIYNGNGANKYEDHYYYVVAAGDTLSDIAAGIAANINQVSATLDAPDFAASSNGPSVTMTWNPKTANQQFLGGNGDRTSVYGFQQGDVNCWEQPSASFSGGQFPSTYQITIDFAQLKTEFNIPTDNVRKIRWTWAADLQTRNFVQTEFRVQVSNWTITGQNRIYSVAGPGSRRIEDNGPGVAYLGSGWVPIAGNYSGGTIQSTNESNDSCTIVYNEANEHQLYLGTRLLNAGASISVSVDGQLLTHPSSLYLNGEDVLVRLPLGTFGAGSHTVTIQHQGPANNLLYFDFLEIAYPSTNLPDFASNSQLALATDWDTYHSQSLPAERTVWLIQKLGFTGRVNHYVGALWFYEIYRPQTQYASLTLTVNQDTAGSSGVSPTVKLNITPASSTQPTSLTHLVLPDDTPSTIAQEFAGLINSGINVLWASACGNQLTLTARAMGEDGNNITVELDPSSQGYTLTGGNTLVGGSYGAPYAGAPSSWKTSRLTGARTCQPRRVLIVPHATGTWHTSQHLRAMALT